MSTLCLFSQSSGPGETETRPWGRAVKGQGCWIYGTFFVSPEGEILGPGACVDATLCWPGGGAYVGKV